MRYVHACHVFATFVPIGVTLVGRGFSRSFQTMDEAKIRAAAVDLSKFPADKESTWPYAPEADGWYHAHNTFRGEMEQFASALDATLKRGAKPADWEVAAIQRWWASHKPHIHGHHENEDKLFFPFLSERFTYPPKLESAHATLVQKLDALDATIDALAPDKEGCVAELARSWDEYCALLKPHLVEEEQIIVPMMRAYFTHAEVGKVVEKILGNPDAPREEIGAFVYFMGEQQFREGFMAQEGIPFFVWHIDFSAKYAYYASEVVPQIDALKSGAPPPAPEPPACGGCAIA